MSKNIFLVKYRLEDNIPIDETSDNVCSAYLPDELYEYIKQQKLINEIYIKESSGAAAELPIKIIEDDNSNLLASLLLYLEKKLFMFMQEANTYHEQNITCQKKIDEDLEHLITWLHVWKLFKEKKDKYAQMPEIKIVLG